MSMLPKQFIRKPFSYKDAVKEGLTKYELTKLMKKGVVERVSRGIYVSSNYDATDIEAQFYLAMMLCGQPSCICLLSALDFYHVTDQIPNKIWVMVQQTKRVQTDRLKLIRARKPQWNVGIDKTNNYWITTLPRTLVECLLYKKRIGSDIAINALKTALQNRKVKLQEVIRIANRLGVKQRIYPYIETLAT
jgi:predicted transcriptional regulator of viral defense system